MDALLIAAPRTESPPGSSAPGTAPRQPGRASGGEPRARPRALPAATSVPPLCHKVTTGAATLLAGARGVGHPAQHVPAPCTPVPPSHCPTHIPVQPSVTPVQSPPLTMAVLCRYHPAVAQQSPVLLSLAWHLCATTGVLAQSTAGPPGAAHSLATGRASIAAPAPRKSPCCHPTAHTGTPCSVPKAPRPQTDGTRAPKPNKPRAGDCRTHTQPNPAAARMTRRGRGGAISLFLINTSGPPSP